MLIELAGLKLLLAHVFHAFTIKNAVVLVLPSVLLIIALRTVDVDPSVRHAFYTYMHVHSPSTTVTLIVAAAWAFKRALWRKRLPIAPFFFVWLGFLVSMIPSLPSPWTYMFVIAVFWALLLAALILFFKRPLRWIFQLTKPRAA